MSKLDEGLTERVAEQKRRDAEAVDKHGVLFQPNPEYFGLYVQQNPHAPFVMMSLLRSPRADVYLNQRIGQTVSIPIADLPAVIAKLQSFLPPGPAAEKVVHCPHCGSQKTNDHAPEWEARSLDECDLENTATLQEWQCHECFSSFWF